MSYMETKTRISPTFLSEKIQARKQRNFEGLAEVGGFFYYEKISLPPF